VLIISLLCERTFHENVWLWIIVQSHGVLAGNIVSEMADLKASSDTYTLWKKSKKYEQLMFS
jgi:hypothetical protein